MGLESFRITEQKALRLAECAVVPPIMVIAGPNGVGKSTLLWHLKQRTGNVQVSGNVLYLPPHRIWRRQSIQYNLLWGTPLRFSDSLASNSVQGYQGMRMFEGSRSADSADEAFSVVKYALAQFETRKQSAVSALLESRGHVTKEDVGDIYAPVRTLTQFLLPHLTFSRIDATNRGDVRCLWSRTDGSGTMEIDMDDLSSGERAVVSLFMPFLEDQIDEALSALESAVGVRATPKEPQDIVVLVDEPELHLHPVLQARLLDYLRALAARGRVQFVLATHSPTLLAAAEYTELFVLTPPLSGEPQNQLVQLADSHERLAAMRDLCGDTYVLTACRSIVCLEGEAPASAGKAPPDARIYELLCPELAGHILLPFGGKQNVIQAAQRLRGLLEAEIPVVSVMALVDSDQDDGPAPEPWIVTLPVAMMENFLLDAETIWAFLQPHREKSGINSAADVEKVLRSLALARREDEISLRVLRKLRPRQISPRGASLAAIKTNLETQLEEARRGLPSDEDLQRIIVQESSHVDKILNEQTELQHFHGKELLRAFHQKHVNPIGIGHRAFVLELARTLANDADRRLPIATVVAEVLRLNRLVQEPVNTNA